MMGDNTGPQKPHCHIKHIIFPLSCRRDNRLFIKGTGSRLSASSLIKLLFSNLLLTLSVTNPTRMYLSDLRVYFKVKVYFRVTWSGMEEYENRRKISGLCQHYQRWIYCWPEGFIPWLINLQLFAPKLITWLPGECADWFFDNIMTLSYCFHRRYSISRQKNSI